MLIFMPWYSIADESTFFNYMLAMIPILELLVYRALKMNRYAK